VTAEFEAFLKCGVLAYGFLRFKCEDCKFERLVAFSCKKRGFCASCGARRMAETSIHLSDNVFPSATLIRQWVLSIPVPLRYMCARNSELQGKILRLTNAVIAKSIKNSVPGLNPKNKKLQTGAVTLIQRFGGHVNLNIHFHMLHVQGAWEISADKTAATFHAADNPTGQELLASIDKIAAGTIKILKKMKLIEQSPDGINVVSENSDKEDTLSNIQAASTANKIALGQRKGKNIRRLIERFEEEFRSAEPHITGDMAANFMGFSLHAGVSVWSSNKARLEQLIRYTARPAVSEERLSQAPNGDIHYKLKKPWTDGTTAVIFSPLEFLEKLASLVPPPRIHLTRFHGILAPHSQFRKLVVPKKPEEKIAEPTSDKTLPLDNQKQNRISWAKLLSRVFAIDMETCELCGGQMKVISAILKQDVIEKVLSHLGLPARAPPIAASRIPHQEGFWDQTPDYGDYSQLH
jgi:hypothetical protein